MGVQMVAMDMELVNRKMVIGCVNAVPPGRVLHATFHRKVTAMMDSTMIMVMNMLNMKVFLFWYSQTFFPNN